MANIRKGTPDDRQHTRSVSDDGTRILDVIDRAKAILSDNPKDFPVLTAAHLMGGAATEATDTGVRNHLDAVMPRDLRARAVGAALFKRLRDADAILLYDVYLLQRRGFVQLVKDTMRPDSLASGLTDMELERSWEIFEYNMQLLANAGARMRKRKDWRS